MKIYFGIDCAPGGIRPNTYAERVFEKLGINSIEAYNKCFGAWEWEVKENYLDVTLESTDSELIRSRWIIDKNIPIFRGEGREYIERFVNVGEVQI